MGMHVTVNALALPSLLICAYVWHAACAIRHPGPAHAPALVWLWGYALERVRNAFKFWRLAYMM